MDTSFINKNKIKTRLCQMLTMQKLSNGKDSCCCFSLLLLRCLGTQGKARRQDIFLFFFFATLDQDEPVKWEMLTCLHLGVVHPVSDLFLTDEVIYNLHPDWRL